MADQTSVEFPSKVKKLVRGRLECELKSGGVIAERSGSYVATRHIWIPEDVLEADIEELPIQEDSDLVELKNELDPVRELDEEAVELLEILDDRVDHPWSLEVDPELMDNTLTSNAKIPARFYSQGPAIIAAYLAIHDVRRSGIASLLDVSESTVSQYLSDLRAGRR